MDFLGIGPLELLLIAIVFLVVMGPDKLPIYGRKAGEFIAKARRTVNEAKNALEDETEGVGKSGKSAAESVRNSIDLPPSPDFDLTFTFESTPGASSSHQPQPKAHDANDGQGESGAGSRR